MSVLPILEWLPRYQRRFLRGDLVAGVSSWALVVPQSVACGQSAGMPAQAGLAATFAGSLGYALRRLFCLGFASHVLSRKWNRCA